MNPFDSALPGDDSLFRALLESAPDAMVIVNQAGEIVLLNSQAEQMFGYEREELLGKPIEILVPERFRRHHHRERHGYVEAPAVHELGSGPDLYALRKNGKEFPAEIRLSPLRTGGDTLVISSIRDVTDRKRLERALKERNAELSAMNGSVASGTLTRPKSSCSRWTRTGGLLS